jgi:hypothetical protein
MIQLRLLGNKGLYSRQSPFKDPCQHTIGPETPWPQGYHGLPAV